MRLARRAPRRTVAACGSARLPGRPSLRGLPCGAVDGTKMPGMTASPITDGLENLFKESALAHVSYVNGKGQIVSWPMWVDYDGEHLLISSPVGSRKGRSFRERAQVGISIVSPTNPWHWLSVSGRVVDIRPDEDLAFIDRMSQKYLGTDYSRRSPREVFTVSIDRVTSSSERLARWSQST